MSRSRYVFVALAVVAFIVGTMLSHALQWTWVRGGFPNPHLIIREITLTKAIAFGLAISGMVFCLMHQTTWMFLTEVADELSRVSWPTRAETGHATWVVVVTVLISSAYLGVFDSFWLWLTNWILGVELRPPQ